MRALSSIALAGVTYVVLVMACVSEDTPTRNIIVVQNDAGVGDSEVLQDATTDGALPFATSRISRIASNAASSCVLLQDDGSLYCVGIVSSGVQMRDVKPDDHACVGFNLSSASGTAKLERLTVEPLDDIAVAERARCGIVRKDKSVTCWGRNYVGELGHTPGTSGDETCSDGLPCRKSPVQVPLPSASFAQVVAGLGHFCARTTEGRVFCWGWNDNEQVGKASATGGPIKIEAPVAVSLGGRTAALLASGPFETCAVVKSPEPNPGVYCWGLTRGLAPWPGATSEANIPPTLVPGTEGIASTIRELAVGIYGGCALFVAPASKPWCWGDAATGLLAGSAADAGAGFSPPREIAELPSEASNLGIGMTGFALRVAGGGVTWGSNANAELATGRELDASAGPALRSSLAGVRRLHLAPNHALAIQGETVVAWGKNECGELGHAPNTSNDTPCDDSVCNGVPQVVPSP